MLFYFCLLSNMWRKQACSRKIIKFFSSSSSMGYSHDFNFIPKHLNSWLPALLSFSGNYNYATAAEAIGSEEDLSSDEVQEQLVVESQIQYKLESEAWEEAAKSGAAAVNLVAGDKAVDVYSEIAARVLDIMRKDAEKDPASNPNALHARLLINQVDRKLVKQTVMTSVYGVTYVDARDQIKKILKERCAIADDSQLFGAACYAAKTTLNALGEMFEAAGSIMSWLGDCAKIMVKQQRTAFPPNFVHSLDSSHTMMTAVACKKEGLNFTGVHDSYWTHAYDVDEMNRILREKFVELYGAPIMHVILNSRFMVSHVLAGKRRFKDLHLLINQMVEEGGSGSAPSLCELLLNSFQGWDSNIVVWDMLAFAYSRFDMVQDALFVLAKMKNLNLRASIQTYNSLLYNLRHTDIMWDVHNEIKVGGTPENEYTNSILIHGLCEQSKLQDAVSFLQNADGKDTGLSVVSFNTIMTRFCKLGFVDVAKSFFCLMLKYGLLPDSYSYNILIHGLCVAGSMEEALEFTNDMEKHGVEPDVVTYNILAKGFHLLGSMSGAWKVIQDMLLKGFNPDLVTYTILICGHCQAGNIEEGLKLQEEMLSQGFHLSIISYSVLLSCLCKSARVEEALILLSEMEAVGLKSDIITYSILIHGLCKKGDVQRAIQLYEEMCSREIFPNHFTHSAILLGLCEKGNISEARKYFDNLITSDLVEDIVLYNIMMDGYVKVGDIAEAVQLYQKLTEQKISPSIVTFNTLIHGFCKNNKLDEAWRLMDTFKLHGLVPSVVTYTTLMNACCEVGNVHGMLELLREMEAKAVMPTHVTYTVVIKGLCKQWKLQESVQLLEDMRAKDLTPDQITYNTIIQCFCKARDMRKAFQLHNEMLLHNLEPTPVTYNVLINGLCVYGDLKDADSLLLSLENRKVNLTKVAYTTIVKAHCAKGDVSKAVIFFRQMVEKGFKISVRDYSAVINRLCKRYLINEAKYFFCMMLSDGISPDQEICEVMLKAFHQEGDLDSFFELLAEIIKCGLLPD